MKHQILDRESVNEESCMKCADLKSRNPGELQYIQNCYLTLMQSFLTGVQFRDLPLINSGSNTFDLKLREQGLDWPSQALTMIGVKRLANLRALTETVIKENIPGDLIETGVWRGGACILMRAVLFAYNVYNRKIWVADSFAGLPPADEIKYPADVGSNFHKFKELAVSLEEVQGNFKFFELLDNQTEFLKGWFKDTLPTAKIDQLALMRLDGDMYESTIDALTCLYPKLSPNGFVIIDDYHIVPECKEAVNDYCRSLGIKPEIVEIDGVGIYWRKSTENQLKNWENKESQVTINSHSHIQSLYQSALNLSLKTINRLSKVITDRDDHIVKIERTIVDLDSKVIETSQLITEYEKQLSELKQTLVARDFQIEELFSSTSWRFSYPLRFLKNYLKKGFL